MDKLWAPWRINYLRAKKSKICIFCKAFKSNKDKENFVIYRSKFSFAILNIFPYNNGHTMVAPVRHISCLSKLENKEILDLNLNMVKIINVLKKTLKPEGFNIGINLGKCAGAGVPGHLHIHIVPRWKGDTNFMPTVAETKIISQSLEELYLKLKKYL